MAKPAFQPRNLAFIYLILAFTFSACKDIKYRPSAVGRDGEVTIVADSALWNGPVGDALREQIGAYLQTLPAPEPAFSLKHADITSERAFDQIKKQKNLVFVAPLEDSSNVARFLESRLDEGARSAVLAGQSAVVPRRDLWRRHQQVVYIVAATADSLIAAINDSGADIRYTFDKVTRERTEVKMFEKGRQKDLENRLMNRHQFAVNVQHDYFMAIDTTDFVWLRRVVSSDSWRSLFVYYEDRADPSKLTPEWVMQKQDSLSRTYLRGNLGGYASIDHRRPLVSDNINFKDRFAFEIRGLWHMIGDGENGGPLEFGMGGPFTTYGFYDQSDGRIYIICGMVFAPGYAKREFLRQMETIAYTFRSGAESTPIAGLAE